MELIRELPVGNVLFVQAEVDDVLVTVFVGDSQYVPSESIMVMVDKGDSLIRGDLISSNGKDTLNFSRNFEGLGLQVEVTLEYVPMKKWLKRPQSRFQIARDIVRGNLRIYRI